MSKEEKVPEFSLLGGPLQWLGCRLGLVRGGTGTIGLGLALGLPAWGILVALALLEGQAADILSLAVIGVHVRLLVAIPLFFAGESFVVPRMAEFVGNIRSSGLVPEDARPALDSEIRRVARLKDSWLPEVLFLLLTFGWLIVRAVVDLPGLTGNFASFLPQPGRRLTPVNGWYVMFCLPLFRYLLLRWLWHLGLWWYFLGRLSKLRLHLFPTHSDGAAGLGYLEVVQEHFMPLALALAAVFSASFAQGVLSGKMAFETLYLMIPAVLFLVALLFIGPLFLFTRKLWNCRSVGLDEYMAMASRYVQAFERRWLRDKEASGESQLGTSDIQSLADLTNSVNVVRHMRLAPCGQRLGLELAACVIVPMLPLILLKVPVDQLAAWLFKALTGI